MSQKATLTGLTKRRQFVGIKFQKNLRFGGDYGLRKFISSANILGYKFGCQRIAVTYSQILRWTNQSEEVNAKSNAVTIVSLRKEKYFFWVKFFPLNSLQINDLLESTKTFYPDNFAPKKQLVDVVLIHLSARCIHIDIPVQFQPSLRDDQQVNRP